MRLYITPVRTDRSNSLKEEYVMESVLSELGKKEVWEKFYDRKISGIYPPAQARELREFIDKNEFIDVCREIAGVLDHESSFPLPRRATISKMSTQKKRTVYIYPRKETVTLKLLTYLVLRKYDNIFQCDSDPHSR